MIRGLGYASYFLTVADVTDLVASTGPVQSQTARSPFIGLAARAPGVTHAAISAAYDSGALVRGSTIRGTVHTATPEQYAAAGAATRVGQRVLWQRMLKLEQGQQSGPTSPSATAVSCDAR